MGRRTKKKPGKAGGAAASAGEKAKEEEEEEEEKQEEEEYVPVDGSWVAELEAAKEEELSEILDSPGGDRAGAVPKRRGEALKVYLRLCRSYRMLRQWDKLEDAATKGLRVCSSYSARSAGTKESGHGVATTGASRISAWEGRFNSYKERSEREKSVPSIVDEPVVQEIFAKLRTGTAYPDRVCTEYVLFPNSNVFQFSVLVGDMPLMEAMVARGAAIDYPFPCELGNFREMDVAPGDATALVVACANLALADNDHPALAHARLTLSFAWKDGQLDGSTKCAMQLVQLGANPTRKFNLDNARDSVLKQVLRLAGMDGKSALQLAQMTKRKELVELMEQHLRYSLEERADVVHCRCGSRLPWKSCHATGLGQPPHFRVRPTLGGLVYRFSPYARCPCKNTTLAHYDCCWKETATPAYLIDNNADLAWMYRLPKYSYAGQVAREVLEREGPNAVFSGEAMDRIEIGSLLRSPTTSSLRALFAAEGPKSQWEAWDPAVYAGCVERLDRPFFLWKDLHWKLDKSELLRRTEAWNKALDRYCSDMDLVGEDRDRVVARHAANPCAPCGRDGCDAFENEVREFPRCSRCKMIAYCGRACQKMDWAHHGRTCRLV